MTGAVIVALLLACPAVGIVVMALDLVTDPDWAPHPRQAGSLVDRPVVTTPAPDPRWLASWLPTGPTALYRPGLVRPPRPARLDLLDLSAAWCRSWDRPTPAWASAPTTAQMETVDA